METMTIGRTPIHVLKFQLIGLQVAGRQYEITGANLEAVRWQGRSYSSAKDGQISSSAKDGQISFGAASLVIKPGFEMIWRTAP